MPSKLIDPYTAVADPTRRSILEMLRDEQPLAAGDIARRFPRVSRAAVSKHLGVLRRSRLVRAQHRGRENLYRLEARRISEIMDWLNSLAPAYEQALERLKQRAERDE